MGEQIVVLSANCQGLQDHKKAYDVLHYYKDIKPDILCLQDTHWVSEDESRIRSIWGNECFLNGCKTNARGVAIFLGDQFEFKVHNVHKDTEGSLIAIDIKISDYEIKLINVYGPNKDSLCFITN